MRGNDSFSVEDTPRAHRIVIDLYLRSIAIDEKKSPGNAVQRLWNVLIKNVRRHVFEYTSARMERITHDPNFAIPTGGVVNRHARVDVKSPPTDVPHFPFR